MFEYFPSLLNTVILIPHVHACSEAKILAAEYAEIHREKDSGRIGGMIESFSLFEFQTSGTRRYFSETINQKMIHRDVTKTHEEDKTQVFDSI